MDVQRRAALIIVTHDVGCASCMCDWDMTGCLYIYPGQTYLIDLKKRHYRLISHKMIEYMYMYIKMVSLLKSHDNLYMISRTELKSCSVALP